MQRISGIFNVDTERHIGGPKELHLRRGKPVRDGGRGTVGDDEAIAGRLVTAFDPDA